MKKIFNLALALVLIVALVTACNQPTPTPGPSRGVTNYDALSVAAGTAAAPSFYFGTDSDTGFYWSSANVIGLAAAGSSVATFSASAYAPVGALNLTQVNAAGGSANPLDYTGSLGIMNGSDDFTAIDINITNANHTSTGNTVQAIDIANITGDADATETAINVGTGWDSGLTMASPATFSDAATFASTIASTLVNAANGSANPFDYTGSLGIMNGSDDFTLFDVNLTNADHSGSNTIQVLDVANITGDAQTTENAIQVGTGWDLGLNLNSPADMNAQIISNIGNAGTDFQSNGGLTLANALIVTTGGATANNFQPSASGSAAAAVYCMSSDCDTGFWYPGDNMIAFTTQGVERGRWTASSFTIGAPAILTSTASYTLVNAADGGANPWDYTGALGIMNGGDDFTLFDVNITNADHTGSNTIQVLDVANITGDAEATENAIQVGTGWDLGLNLNSPANLNAQIISNIGNAGTDFLANGGLTLANALIVTTGGATVSAGNLAVSTGTMAGPAEGNVVVNALHDVTVAELNAANHVLVTVPAALSFRLVDAIAIPYGGGTCSANTTVNISTTSATLLTYAQANLVQSAILDLTATGVTALADGASFSAMAAGEDVYAVNIGTNVATCTGVRFILSYVLQ